MGVVYKGELVAIGKPVAIKFLHDALAAIPDLVKRFQREATAMSRLAHPHLVSVVDSGLANGVPFLVMDFVSGRSLAEVLSEGALPAARAVGLTRQILAGVKHAHGMGVVHRDLKPDNILVMADVEEDFVKILDFGLAKVVSSGETQLTNTGFAMGTPGYMSPEQARGTEADERSDLYGVGVILFHMVTGRKPFVADSPLAVLRMHMDDAPPSPNALLPRSCSPELERVILRSLEKEPGARWQTAADFAAALAQTPEAAGQAPPAIDDVPPARLRVKRARARLIGRVVVAGLVAAGVVATWSHLSRRQQQNVRRHVGEAVKLAGNALDPNDPTAPPTARPVKPSTGKPTNVPAKTNAPVETKPPVVAKAEPPPPASAPTPPPVPEQTPTPPANDNAGKADDDDDDDDAVEEPIAPKDTPGARLEQEIVGTPSGTTPARPPMSAPAHAKPLTTRDAQKLLAAGHVDEAIKVLYDVRSHSTRNAGAALLLGHAYFRKLWRTDGLREYDAAVKLEPALKRNQLLQRNAVSALDDPTYRLARAVIKFRLGSAALGEVRRAARSSPNPRVKKRAAHLAAQLGHGRRR